MPITGETVWFPRGFGDHKAGSGTVISTTDRLVCVDSEGRRLTVGHNVCFYKESEVYEYMISEIEGQLGELVGLRSRLILMCQEARKGELERDMEAN